MTVSPGDLQAQINARQAKASNPKASAWVSANAGSGKTHVLTQRVLRLLLNGVEPSRILCLTFTKAAAANMSDRVFRTLGDWTRIEDGELAQKIIGTGEGAPTADTLSAARRLFARAVETPGGLKIQTIHAFCERVLHVFPFEADAPAGFRVLEDDEAAELREQARRTALARDFSAPEDRAALALVADEAGAEVFDRLLTAALKRRAEVPEADGLSAYDARVCVALEIDAAETADGVLAEIAAPDARAIWRRLAEDLARGSARDKEIGSSFSRAAAAVPDLEAATAAFEALFTKKGGPRSKSGAIATDAARKAVPTLEAALQHEQVRLDDFRRRLRDQRTRARSVAVMRVARIILAHYAHAKSARGWLDFNDLIGKTLDLLTRADAGWVLYKLDAGIEHILVDEAQDTSPEQWRIVEKLAAEFTAGHGASRRRRTLFAVGDEKQSIYSFQGADPKLFAQFGRTFEGAHQKADLQFERTPLNFSFRSAPEILDTVDRVIGVDALREAMSDDPAGPAQHQAVHAHMRGRVEVWDVVAPEPEPSPEDWRMPLDRRGIDAPPVTVATRVADIISSWIAPRSRERLYEPKTRTWRRIQASDVLILVRSRGPFFEAIGRALKSHGVAAAGADRLKLVEDIGVMDLLAAGRAALVPADDLALACTLKSPLIGIDEDALLRLAAGRTASLAEALEAASEPALAAAHARFAAWRRAAQTATPFEFYARILGPDGGRRALTSRLGPETADAIEEFLVLALEYGRKGIPSLSEFLESFEGSQTEIKRDLDGSAAGVRVMTVHAAKGLEAPIVLLPDSAFAPRLRGDDPFLRFASRDGEGTIFWAPPAALETPATSAARAAADITALQEHFRLLYVAMTRAEQRLIVAGFVGKLGKDKPIENSWHAHVASALIEGSRREAAPWDTNESILVFGGAGEILHDGAGRPPFEATFGEPEWLRRPAPRKLSQVRLRPSGPVDTLRAAPARIAAMDYGRLGHDILEAASKTAPSARLELVLARLARGAPDLSQGEREAVAGNILTIIEAPRLAPLFGPTSKSEVAISALTTSKAGREFRIIGRIDRLALVEDRIYLAEFKFWSTMSLLSHEKAIRQLSLYGNVVNRLWPKRELFVFLIKIANAEIEEIGAELLRKAWIDAVESNAVE